MRRTTIFSVIGVVFVAGVAGLFLLHGGSPAPIQPLAIPVPDAAVLSVAPEVEVVSEALEESAPTAAAELEEVPPMPVVSRYAPSTMPDWMKRTSGAKNPEKISLDTTGWIYFTTLTHAPSEELAISKIQKDILVEAETANAFLAYIKTSFHASRSNDSDRQRSACVDKSQWLTIKDIADAKDKMSADTATERLALVQGASTVLGPAGYENFLSHLEKSKRGITAIGGDNVDLYNAMRKAPPEIAAMLCGGPASEK